MRHLGVHGRWMALGAVLLACATRDEAPPPDAFFDAAITPGEYVLVCMATAPDGRSHIEHGMIRQISVR